MNKPIIPKETSVMGIFCKEEFEQLTQKEQSYCYYLSKASWEGSKICYFQRSYESPPLFIIFQLIFSSQGQTLQEYKQQALQQISQTDIDSIITYVASFFNNCGNYKSFGHQKFIPDVSQETFKLFITLSQNYLPYKNLIDELWNDVVEFMYNYTGKLEKLGFPPEQGQSGYYSQNLTQQEIIFIDEFLQIMTIDPLNTRIVKNSDEQYTVYIASVKPKNQSHVYQNKKINIIYGDFSSFLSRSVEYLQKAAINAANPVQKQMIDKYIEHFIEGDIEIHKDSQRLWIQDKSPIVETNMGFIESYRDPRQVRAEFQGFVSLVNKQQSLITNNFVKQVPDFLKMMPWPKEFEKNEFLKPDFTVLSVLTFARGGTPLGINIPNYDDIRQEEGFKNVYLGNCVPKQKAGNVLFLNQKDQEIIFKWQKEMMFQQVIFHELLGHGCGKIFQKTGNGLNFDTNIINPLTGKKVETFYNEKDTWSSVFQSISNPFEECRADSVALYFSCFPESVNALQPEINQYWKELCIGQFINFVYQGVNGLQFYNSEAKKWGQAHINGRWVILQVLLEAGNNFVIVDKVQDTIEIKIDHEQCFTTGKKALGDFLLKLQVYKATADFEGGNKMFSRYSQVNEKFLELRDIVISQKKPRRMEIQGHLEMDQQGKFIYHLFEENHEGIIESFIKRYPYFDQNMLQLFKRDQELNRPKI